MGVDLGFINAAFRAAEAPSPLLAGGVEPVGGGDGVVHRGVERSGLGTQHTSEEENFYQAPEVRGCVEGALAKFE
jgi:hypothetical protein